MKYVYSLNEYTYENEPCDTREAAFELGNAAASEQGLKKFFTGVIKEIDLEKKFSERLADWLNDFQWSLNDENEASLHELCIAEVLTVSPEQLESFEKKICCAFRVWLSSSKVKPNVWSVDDERDHIAVDPENFRPLNLKGS